MSRFFRRAPVVATALLLACATAGAEQAYRWVDARGVVHYSDRRSGSGEGESVQLKAPRKLGNGNAMALPLASPAATAEPLEVVMYTTQTCKYCRQARDYFRKRGIAWREIDIDSSAAAAAEHAARGGQGVPLIFINDSRMSGFSAESMDQLLRRYGH